MLHQHNTALWLDLAHEHRAKLAQEAAKQHALNTLKRQTQGTFRGFSWLPWRQQNQVTDSISTPELTAISTAN
jgi:hypothetical protein